MFKNRSFIVKMAKDTDIEEIETAKASVLIHAQRRELIEEVMGGIIVAVGTYFVADTFRQVAIYTAIQKITPRVPRVIAEVSENAS